MLIGSSLILSSLPKINYFKICSISIFAPIDTIWTVSIYQKLISLFYNFFQALSNYCTTLFQKIWQPTHANKLDKRSHKYMSPKRIEFGKICYKLGITVTFKEICIELRYFVISWKFDQRKNRVKAIGAEERRSIHQSSTRCLDGQSSSGLFWQWHRRRVSEMNGHPRARGVTNLVSWDQLLYLVKYSYEAR